MSLLPKILNGAYDLHVHVAPDAVPRAQSALSLAEAAQRAGMAGIGIKDHLCSTVGRCHVLNESFPDGTRFYSSLVLNPSVGGLNPTAVESALRAGCDIIYFPTFGAGHQLDVQGPNGMPFPLPQGFRGIRLKEWHSEVDQILEAVATHEAILATGHLSSEESLWLLNRAKALGVHRMVVTHASEPVPGMTIEDQRACVSKGAFIEHCFMACTQCCSPPVSLDELARQIRSVGVEHVVLSSDFGQVTNGPPVAGFLDHLNRLHERGFSEDELRQMIVTNPSRLVGAL